MHTREYPLNEALLGMVGFASALRQLADQFQQQSGLRITLDIQDGAEVLDEPSRSTMFQAVYELLWNVARHADDEGVFVGVRQTEAQLTVTVADEGCGFDAAAVLRVPGTGRSGGLCRIRARLAPLNGTLSVKSIPGNGTIAKLVMPLVVERPCEPAGDFPPPPRQPLPPGTVADARILIADDNALVRRGLSALLRLEPTLSVVGETANGVETVDLARRLKPDVIVMDIRLPGLNGIEATRLIKQEHPGIVVVGLSALGEHLLQEAVREAPFSAVLDKADATTGLALIIRRCLAARRGIGAGAPAAGMRATV